MQRERANELTAEIGKTGRGWTRARARARYRNGKGRLSGFSTGRRAESVIIARRIIAGSRMRFNFPAGKQERERI